MNDNAVAVVTGGARGIGWASAQRFAAQGYRVALVDLCAVHAMPRAGELGVGHLGLGVDGGWLAYGRV